MKIGSIATVAFAAFGVVYLAIWLSNQPIRMAKAKCERHLELMTGHNLRFQDDFAMYVTDDVTNGKVQVAFLQAGELRFAECLLERGEVKRLKLDGEEILAR